MRLLLQDSKNKIEGFYVVEVAPAPIGRGIFSLYLTTPTNRNPRGVTTPHCA